MSGPATIEDAMTDAPIDIYLEEGPKRVFAP